MKILQFIFCLVFITFQVQSQDCVEGSLSLRTQAEVNEFGAQYPNCTIIDGRLRIGNSAIDGNDITDLSPLSNLVRIESSLSIDNTVSLQNLNGLQNIEYIGQDLDIDDNAGLIDISALNQLSFVADDIYFNRLPSLSQIGDFALLDSIHGNFEISNCGDVSLAGFTGLKHIYDLEITNSASVDLIGMPNLLTTGRDIHINNNQFMRTVSGFNKLAVIGEDLIVEDNPLLEAITTFDELSYINSILKISNLPSLINLGDAFINLDSVGRQLFIENTELPDLLGFNSLHKTGAIYIHSNSNLADLHGLEVIQRLQGEIHIFDNANLTSLSGLDNIDVELVNGVVSNTEFTLENNPLLTECDQQIICELFKRENIQFRIMNNAPDCSTFNNIYYNRCRNHHCYDSGFNITSQSQIDSLIIDHPRCTYIPGDIVVGDPTGIMSSDVINLDGLEQLDTIFGDIMITNNPFIQDLEGLDDIEFLQGGLSVENNEILPKIDLLSKIKTLNGDIIINNNPSLTTYSQPRNFNSVNGNIRLNNNEALTIFGTFFSLEYIGGDVSITNHSSLGKIIMEKLQYIGGNVTYANNTGIGQPFDTRKLTKVKGDVLIENNPDFNSFNYWGQDTLLGNFICRNNESLPLFRPLNLSFVGGDLVLENNARMRSVSFIDSGISHIGGDLRLVNNDYLDVPNGGFSGLYGLRGVRSLNGSLIISDNDELRSIDGLDIIQSGGISEIVITNNPKLTNCNIQAVCGLLSSNNGAVTIEGNKELCIDKVTVEDKCNLGHCYGGGVVLKTQAEVDRYVLVTQGCNIVDGDFFLQPNQDSLSLIGLENIELIQGQFRLQVGSRVESLVGLDSLRRVGGNLEIWNTFIDNMEGLGSLESIDGQLFLRESNVGSFTGLYNLESVNSISTFVDGSKSFKGLENLKTIKKGISLSQSPGIESLDGLQNVTKFGGAISAIWCDNLSDVLPLKDIPIDSITTIGFTGNPLLTECSIKLFCDYLQRDPDATVVIGNGVGCETNDDLDCPLSSIGGSVFFDENEDGIRNLDEFGIPNIKLSYGIDGKTLVTNSRGEYRQFLDSNETYQVLLDQDTDWDLTSMTYSYSGTFDPTINPKLNFGLSPTFERESSNLNITSNNIRCNEEGKYFLHIQNTGTQVENGIIVFAYDPQMQYVSSSLPIIVQGSGLGFDIWEYQDLAPYESIKIEVVMKMPNENQSGDVMKSSLRRIVLDQDDNGQIVGSIDYETILRCSYDPNDKQVSPIGQDEEAYVLKDEPLTYTIRFQNTGNDYARNIRLTDTLSSVFDINSFVVVNSSHRVNTEIDDYVVSFLFEDIYLIDSMTNADESQGFVSFTIDFLEEVADFTDVNNSADIFFDFNPPIKTNTVSNTVVKDLPTNASVEELLTSDLSVHPNPTNNLINIETSTQGVIRLYTLQMRSIGNEFAVKPNRNYQIDLSEYPSGIYFISFIEESGKQVRKSIIKN